LNADNKINIEIAERTVKGKTAYYANAKLIKSKFLKRNTKMKIYKKMRVGGSVKTQLSYDRDLLV